MTTYFGTIGRRSSLHEMVRHLVDTRADELIVLDEFDRPAGIVSATDVLIAIVNQMPEQRETRTKPK
jgi:CBS-domain-containing membrane protein